MGEAQLALGHAEGVFDVPAAERDPQQAFQRRVGGGVRDEVLGFSRPLVARHDQPVGPRGQFAMAEEMDLGGSHFPLLVVERQPRELHLSPRLLMPVRTEPREAIDSLAGPALFRSRTARSLRQHAE